MTAPNRIWLDEHTDARLRALNSRCGVTPNLLCRVALCLSLGRHGVPDDTLYAGGRAREFNMPTLLGQHEVLYFALLRERMELDHLDQPSDFETQLRAHICRGVTLLFQRVQCEADLAALLAQPNGANT
jgi:DNA sulfur modification protein DndE